MKIRVISIISAVVAIAMLAACGSTASTESSSAASSEAVSSEVVSSEAVSSEPATEEADTSTVSEDNCAEMIKAVEAVNEVPNPRVIDDFSLENEMMLTKDNIVSYAGDVTNDQADCALVFAAQVKEGTADAVVAELEAYRDTMTSSLYAEFADKVAKAQDARIVSNGSYVMMVIAGVNGPDYADIDSAITAAMGG